MHRILTFSALFLWMASHLFAQGNPELPGRGHGTPIIWKDQLILLSAVQTATEIKPE